MMAFPGMLLEPAEKAGIKTPEDADNFVKEEYPHFHVFLSVQLGQPMPVPTAHWDNAKVIAAIPDDKIRKITYEELIEKGLQVGFSR